MSISSTSTDDQIILTLTRENARLKLTHEMCLTELSAISATLTGLGFAACPVDDPTAFEGLTAREQCQQLEQALATFPLDPTDRYHTLPGQLFKVTIPTSIEPLDYHVVADNEATIRRWLAVTHPHGFSVGYEPRVEAAGTGLWSDTVYLITDPRIEGMDPNP